MLDVEVELFDLTVHQEVDYRAEVAGETKFLEMKLWEGVEEELFCL